MSAIRQHNLLDSYSHRINSSLFLEKERVLEAFDDEYEGVVINPDTLPSNPNVFASTLRSSIYNWKLKV